MVPPPDPWLLFSFPPSPEPPASTSIDKDIDPHREIQDEHWETNFIEEDFAHDSPQTLEVSLDLQPSGKAPPPPGLLADHL
jgi:hypothetical protein